MNVQAAHLIGAGLDDPKFGPARRAAGIDQAAALELGKQIWRPIGAVVL